MMGRGYRGVCAQIPVLLAGDGPQATALHKLLERSAHPVRQVLTWRAAEQAVGGMKVAILFTLPDDLIACAERLRSRAGGLRVVVALAHADAELEELVMLREYLHLTILGANLEALHALVHDVLHVTPSPQPTALS